MVGLSHLYGKIILNVKFDYMPEELLKNAEQVHNIFRVLTNCKIPVNVSTMYINSTTYTFEVLYDFRTEPIPEYLTRVEFTQ